MESYLPRTQTFVFNQIAALEPGEGVVLTEALDNVEEFAVRVPIVEIRRRRIPQLLAVQLALVRRRLSKGPDLLPFSAARVGREVKAREIAVLHAHFGHVGFATLPARRRARLPLVTSFYGFDAGTLARQERWRRGFSDLFATAELFIAEGPAMRERLIRLGCPSSKVRVIPIAINVRHYHYRERLQPPQGYPVRLVFVGRMVEKKGLESVVRAFGEVRSSGVVAHLDIVGDGPLRDRVNRLVADLGIAEDVQFWGMQSHSATLQLLDQAHVLVQPSVTAADGDTEGGAPTVVLEAQAMGLPVIATRHADLPNITAPERSAILCDEGSLDQLARAIVEVSRSPGRWSEMGRRGREFVAGRHDVATVLEKLRDVYRSVVKNQGG